jgi:hypothetical protein
LNWVRSAVASKRTLWQADTISIVIDLTMAKEKKGEIAAASSILAEIADLPFLEAILKKTPLAKAAAENTLPIGRVTTVLKW